MKNANRKRQILVATLVVALGVAVFMNWYFSENISAANGGTTTTGASQGENLGDAQYVNGTPTNKSEYFTSAELERQQARDKSLETLNKVIQDSSASESEKVAAVEKYAAISEYIKTENDIETIIKAKGVSECLVIISEDSAEVIVKTEELDDALSLQVKEAVMNKTNISSEKITIVQVK